MQNQSMVVLSKGLFKNDYLYTKSQNTCIIKKWSWKVRLFNDTQILAMNTFSVLIIILTLLRVIEGMTQD